MATFVDICRVVTVLACCLAAVLLFGTLAVPGQSAIQYAGGAAVALGVAVIPYIFTRMFEGFDFKAADPKPAPRDQSPS